MFSESKNSIETRLINRGYVEKKGEEAISGIYVDLDVDVDMEMELCIEE